MSGLIRKEAKRLSTNGPESHRELYSLLINAKNLYTDALISVTNEQPHPEAGKRIFVTTFNALRGYPEDELPTLDDIDMLAGQSEDAVLPIPVLVTLGYFRDDLHSVCLRKLNFQPIHPYDGVTLSYPNTILWGRPAISRLMSDLAKVFSDKSNQPLLSNPTIRAYQLIRFGRFILEHELKRIGLPKIPNVLLSHKGALH